MSATLEREVKLPFESAEAARAAVLAIGATPCTAAGCRKTACSTRPTKSCAAADLRFAYGRTADAAC